MRAIENFVAQQETDSAAAPKTVSGKSVEQIAAEYETVLKKQVRTTIVVLVLWAPKPIARFFDIQALLGVSESIWLVMQGLGLLVLLWFLIFEFACPNCNRSPGGGWHRQRCKSCGVLLRGNG